MVMRQSFLLDNAHLSKLQSELLDLLVEFDRVCRKHGIRYFLSCGTLLGAVRHHGFIPWDNDVDVELFREDYEKFRSVCSLELNEGFSFLDHVTDEEYFWPFGKLIKKGTSYQRPSHGELKQKNGICIDVFVLDKMPEDSFRQHIMEYVTTFCRKILWAPVGVKAISFSMKWMIFFLLSCIPRTWAYWLHQTVARCYEGTSTPCRGFFCTSFRTPRGYAIKEEWYKHVVDSSFEGHTFPIPGGFHDILYLKYNDYMKLPPEEERRGSSPAEYIRFSDGDEWYATENHDL